MSPRNVIVFSAPDVERSSVIQLAVGQPVTSASSSEPVFKSKSHAVVISGTEFMLYDTAGLPQADDLEQKLDPFTALSNLYQTAHQLPDGVSLLVYVVHDKFSINNYRLFRDIFCNGEVPVVLVTTNGSTDELLKKKPVEMKFEGVFSLRSSGSDLLELFHKHASKTQQRSDQPMERFERTLMESWSLLERTAHWDLKTCATALKDTLTNSGMSDGDAVKRCKKITEYMKKYEPRFIVGYMSSLIIRQISSSQYCRFWKDRGRKELCHQHDFGNATSESHGRDCHSESHSLL